MPIPRYITTPLFNAKICLEQQLAIYRGSTVYDNFLHELQMYVAV